MSPQESPKIMEPKPWSVGFGKLLAFRGWDITVAGLCESKLEALIDLPGHIVAPTWQDPPKMGNWLEETLGTEKKHLPKWPKKIWV